MLRTFRQELVGISIAVAEAAPAALGARGQRRGPWGSMIRMLRSLSRGRRGRCRSIRRVGVPDGCGSGRPCGHPGRQGHGTPAH